MRNLFLTALLLTGNIYAANCSYGMQTFKINWKAFKTYEKIGVSGSFNNIQIASKPSESVDTLLTGSSVIINTINVNSGNPGRDATLVESFFKIQNIQTIKSKILSAKDGKAQVEITLNGITKIIPMNYTVNDQTVTGKGVIDLNDFGMLPSLDGINKACYDLHAGKTWQDVEIGFEIVLQKKCE